MLEKVTYVNHLNESINFGENGLYVESNDLHDYAWSIIEKNDRIAGFKRKVGKRTLPVTIHAASPSAGVAARNRLMEIAEKDVLAMKPGKLIIGDYYYQCFITESTKLSYLKTRRLTELKLALYSDRDFWTRETVIVFRKASESSAQNGQDYPFDYVYDYMPDVQRSTLTNPDFTASNFRMIIYGECSNPAVYVGGHMYAVNCTVAAGEYLTIDSAAKTVRITAKDGTVSNRFNLRNRSSYIFEPIPSGRSTVMMNGDFGVDIVLLEERSEPKWI